MTPQEAYKKFLLKVNKNDTNSNIKVPKGQFVLLFNEQKRTWLESTIKQNEDSDYIDGIEELLELDKQLVKAHEGFRKDDFTLPINFYRRATSFALASKEECTNQVLVIWFRRGKDINVLLQNSDESPSFEYRETLGILNNNKLSVYKTDFTLDKVFLSYYREPRDLDIAGYTKLDGSHSQDIETDLSDTNIESIINDTAKEAVRNYESVTQLQIRQ